MVYDGKSCAIFSPLSIGCLSWTAEVGSLFDDGNPHVMSIDVCPSYHPHVANKIMTKNLNQIVRFLHVFHLLILSAVLLGAYSVQFFLKEQPCPLCLLQRLAMISLSVALICNLKFGIRPTHYGVGIFSSLFGASVSLRQMAMHICPEFPPFGEPIFGLDLYWWAFIVFGSSLFAIALYLLLYSKSEEKKITLNGLEKFACGLVALITLSYVVTIFIECGLGVCAD